MNEKEVLHKAGIPKKKNEWAEKLKSRKFEVWIVYSLLVFISLFKNVLTPEMITWYGIISTAYIGVNVLQDHILSRKKDEPLQ